jgi:hypothetical protein
VVIVAQKHAIPQLHSVTRTIERVEKACGARGKWKFGMALGAANSLLSLCYWYKFNRGLAPQSVRAECRT